MDPWAIAVAATPTLLLALGWLVRQPLIRKDEQIQELKDQIKDMDTEDAKKAERIKVLEETLAQERIKNIVASRDSLEMQRLLSRFEREGGAKDVPAD